MEPHIYNVDLKWVNDRIGEISSPELMDSLDVATPPQFPGGVDGVWSPEHLFTAAVNSCFMTTFLSIAEFSKLEFSAFTCSSEGLLGKIDGKFRMTEIILKPHLTIKSKQDEEKALSILNKSEKACLISNSILSEVKMEATIDVG